MGYSNQNQYYQPGPPPASPPVSTGDWFVTMLLLAIPIVNIIMLLVWAFGGGTNPSKSNYAKAVLIWLLIGFILWAIIMVISLLIGGMAQAMQ